MRWRECSLSNRFIVLTRSIGECHIRNRCWRVELIQMDKRKAKTYRDKLLERREALVGQEQAAEAFSRRRDAGATRDAAATAAHSYTQRGFQSAAPDHRQPLRPSGLAHSRADGRAS